MSEEKNKKEHYSHFKGSPTPEKSEKMKEEREEYLKTGASIFSKIRKIFKRDKKVKGSNEGNVDLRGSDDVELTRCPYCGIKIYKKAKICPNCGREVSGLFFKTKEFKQMGFREQVKEKLKEKGVSRETISRENINTKLSDALVKALKSLGSKIKAEGSKIKGEGKKRAEIAEKITKNSVKLGMLVPVCSLCLVHLFIPSLESFGYPINIPGLSWFVEKQWSIVLIICAFMMGVTLPFSLGVGRYFSFDLGAIFNPLLMTMIGISAATWGFTHVFQPTFKAWMPEEYALMMCLIKYKGSMAICMGVGNQTVQYEKVGTYETLKTDMGVVTPSKSIPPINPIPEMWDDYPYIFTFTLTNENEVGSPYDIVVTDIWAIASSADTFPSDEVIVGDILNFPETPIKPGGRWVVQTEFNPNKIPPNTGETFECSMYTFFRINVSTKQKGGGSSKLGIIESDRGIDNENFMYFFDPDVKTEPGPVDIYTYTLPFIIPWNQLQKWQTDGNHGFSVFIHIDNHGDGELELEKLHLIQETPGIRLTETNGTSFNDVKCGLMSFSKISGEIPDFVDSKSNHIGLCPGKSNYENCISFTNLPKILSNGNIMISCHGSIIGEFVGKTTEFISIDAEYNYTQIYDEQLACYSMSTTTTIPVTTST